LVVSCQRHHDNERALSPASLANSAAVSPLSYHRSTRFADVSRVARLIAASTERAMRENRHRQERDRSNGYTPRK